MGFPKGLLSVLWESVTVIGSSSFSVLKVVARELYLLDVGEVAPEDLCYPCFDPEGDGSSLTVDLDDDFPIPKMWSLSLQSIANNANIRYIRSTTRLGTLSHGSNYSM